MSKKKKAAPKPQLKFYKDASDLKRCGFCPAARIDNYKDHSIVVLHTRTVEEFEAAVKQEAAKKALDLKQPGDRAFAEREVGWERGQTRQETLNLCFKCFSKVRRCVHCDYYCAQELEDKSVIHRCHMSHETFSNCAAIADPKTHFCGDWEQAEPFAEEDILELLTKDTP